MIFPAVDRANLPKKKKGEASLALPYDGIRR
jgi:hypothetical protein